MLNFKKYFKKKFKKVSDKIKTDDLIWGNFGLKALECGYLTNEQILAVVKTIKRYVKKKNTLKVRIVPDFFKTLKPRDVRMGRGKGSLEFKVFNLKAGTVLFELSNIKPNLSMKALKYSSSRLPVKTKIIIKNDKCSDYVKSCW